jgi:Homing endonuclease associated repeat
MSGDEPAGEAGDVEYTGVAATSGPPRTNGSARRVGAAARAVGAVSGSPTTFAVERRQPGHQPSLAGAVNGDRSVRSARFCQEEIIARVQDWARVHGEPPTIRDWDPSRARRSGQEWRAERFEAGAWPSVGMVRRKFGTFNAAVQAAGLAPRQGPRRIKRHLTGSEQVIAAIVEWTKRYGEPPTQADWDPVRARRFRQPWRIVRYRGGDWPSLNTVLYHFGSLGEAVKAAGLQPRHAGALGFAVAEWRACNLRTVAEIGGADGTSRSAIPALAKHVEAVARSRRGQDPEQLRMALLGLASVAIRCASDIAWSGD